MSITEIIIAVAVGAFVISTAPALLALFLTAMAVVGVTIMTTVENLINRIKR